MHTIGSFLRGGLVVAACATLLGAAGCQKKGGSPSPGPGGSWLVGENGLMANLRTDGTLGSGYDLESDHDLLDIACRGRDTAFVVGEAGTLLSTFDAGASWEVIDLGTTRTLRSVATWGSDTVFVAGDGILTVSHDSGATWHDLPADASTSWLSIGAGHTGTGVVALSQNGTVWRYESDINHLTEAAALSDARAVAVSHDGTHAAVVGAGSTVLRSSDSGITWRRVSLGRDLDLQAAWETDGGALLAVGSRGTIVRVGADDQITSSTVSDSDLRSIHIDKLGHGLAGGDGGALLETRDGGQTWTKVPVAVSGAIYGLDEIDGFGHL